MKKYTACYLFAILLLTSIATTLFEDDGLTFNYKQGSYKLIE